MTKHSIYIVTYERGTYALSGQTKPYHWSYFIQTELSSGANKGIAHQLHGMPGGFYYQGPEELDLEKEAGKKEELQIGEIDDTKLGRMHEICKSLQIDTREWSGWNCQNWTLDGFEKLKSEGFIYDHLTREIVKEWLKEV